eukprot:2710135-Rhodomonas_salina.1
MLAGNPPQSTPVSLLISRPSLQLGVRRDLSQEPPQSTPVTVSSPFSIPSAHVASTHALEQASKSSSVPASRSSAMSRRPLPQQPAQMEPPQSTAVSS